MHIFSSLAFCLWFAENQLFWLEDDSFFDLNCLLHRCEVARKEIWTSLLRWFHYPTNFPAFCHKLTAKEGTSLFHKSLYTLFFCKFLFFFFNNRTTPELYRTLPITIFGKCNRFTLEKLLHAKAVAVSNNFLHKGL